MRINSPEDLNYNYSYSERARRNTFRRRKRKQQLIRNFFIVGVVFIVAAVLFHFASTFIKKKTPPKRPAHSTSKDKPVKKEEIKFTPIPSDASQIPTEVIQFLNENASKDKQYAKIVNHYTEYPVDLLTLLYHNNETLSFVANYPKDRTTPVATQTDSVTQGTVPHFLQWDSRWGYTSYGDNLLAISGCGPTAIAMVSAGLTGDNTITPYKIAQYSEANGYYVKGKGSSWDLIRYGAQPFGITCKELILDESTIKKQLQAGHPIICSMRPGDFTTTGHFIVMTGYEDGKLHVLDPNSKEKSAKPWTYDQLAPQINNLWAFSK